MFPTLHGRCIIMMNSGQERNTRIVNVLRSLGTASTFLKPAIRILPNVIDYLLWVKEGELMIRPAKSPEARNWPTTVTTIQRRLKPCSDFSDIPTRPWIPNFFRKKSRNPPDGLMDRRLEYPVVSDHVRKPSED